MTEFAWWTPRSNRFWIVRLVKTQRCEIHVSGGEYNVAANLPDAFGLRAAIVLGIVDYPVGELVAWLCN